MAGKISLSDVELDRTAENLRKVGGELEHLEKRLLASLANGSPGPLGEFIRSEVHDVRHRTALTRESAGRQAGELNTRAVLARIADDRGTEKDVTVLLSLCAGRNAIDPDKRKKLAASITKLAGMIVSGTIGAGKDGKQSPVDLALDRWAQWFTQAKNDGKTIGKNQSLGKLKTTVLGKLVATFVPGDGVGAAALVGAGWLNGGTTPPPVVTPAAPAPDVPQVTVPDVTAERPPSDGDYDPSQNVNHDDPVAATD